MQLSYQQYDFELLFQKEIHASIKIVSTLRSILGMNLKSMCCIAKKSSCDSCIYASTCAYATLFESIVSKDNSVLVGRNTAPHPYVLSLGKNDSLSKKLLFTLMIFGKYAEYFPYIYGAFVRAGKNGFGKERIPFVVKDVAVDGESILESEEKIKTDFTAKIWKSAENENEKNGEILIRLKTPLRYKVESSLANKIDAKEFMACLYRRAKTLCGFYGTFSEEKEKFDAEKCDFSVAESAINWRENPRYSARQKTEMSLGGMTGDFVLRGKFRRQDLDLIEFARLFGAGKNTNFGLGQIDVWERVE